MPCEMLGFTRPYRRSLTPLIAACVALFAAPAPAAPPKLPQAAPADAGMNEAKLAAIETAVREALAAKQMPGCVVLVAWQSKIAYLRAFGDRRIEPEREPMTVDTVFDLASLTKPLATASSVMLLIAQGKLQLDDPVGRHLPEFAGQGKQDITVRHLLTHQSGLIADNPLVDFNDGPAKAIERLFALTPLARPAEKFIYSDVGFMVLGELVRRASGQDVNDFSKEHLFAPLGLTETGFLPPEPLRRRAAPTQQREGRWMQGEVHDPRAYALGGIAGHAGLFSTAADLAVYAEMLLGEGEYSGVRVLARETVAAMRAPQSVPGGGLRGLGWDMKTGYSSNRGEGFSPQAVGHGGFTGTAFWIDPELRLAVIFLSNRVHPNGKGPDGTGNVNRLAGRIGTIAAAAIRP